MNEPGPPSYEVSEKKEFVESVVTEAIGGYLDNDNVRKKIKKEISQLADTLRIIEKDFAKITPEIQKLDDNQVLKKPLSEDWRGLHNVCHPHCLISVV